MKIISKEGVRGCAFFNISACRAAIGFYFCMYTHWPREARYQWSIRCQVEEDDLTIHSEDDIFGKILTSEPGDLGT